MLTKKTAINDDNKDANALELVAQATDVSSDKAEENLTPMQRKARKLKRDPKLFVADSKAYLGAQKTLYLAHAKLGSFILVILVSFLVVLYYTAIASPRYSSQVQFVVKQASSGDVGLAGLAGLGATTPSMRDSLILKEYISSREMAQALNQSIDLKAHYENSQWDGLSRLGKNSTTEAYIEYYQAHITIKHDELSEILSIEVQSFDAEYSLKLAKNLLKISDEFINNLGEGMAKQQMSYAQQDVDRAFNTLKEKQAELITFQNKYNLYNPEQQGSSLMGVIVELEAQIVTLETEVKSLKAYMHDGSAEIKVKQYHIEALKEQLTQEKSRLTSDSSQSLNKINLTFQGLKLSSELSTDLYKSALASLELVRADAYKKLKYLLVVEQPYLAQEDKYPRRLYSITTWFVVLLLIYGVVRLVFSIIKEHQ